MKSHKLALILIVIAIYMCGGSLYAQKKSTGGNNIEAKKEQQKKLQNDIKFLDRQIQQTSKSRANKLQELKLIQRKAELRKRLIDRIGAEIASKEEEIANKNATIDALEKKLDTLQNHYKQAIYKAYQNRDSRLWFMHILASQNLEQGYRRWSYLKNYTRSLNTQALSIKATKKELEEERLKIAELKATKEEEQSAKTKEYAQLKADESTTQKKVKDLSKQQTELKKELKSKQQQADRLNKEIQKMIASAIASEKKAATPKKGSSGGATSKTDKAAYTPTPESVKLSNEFAANKGKLPWPVKQGVVVEKFGENPHPTLKGIKLPFNNGINISAPRGCNVMSVFNGVVKQIIYIPGYNNCILIAHGGYFTFYCKIGKVNVKANQKVTTGQVIGSLDNSESTSELHFEIWNANQKQNPSLWLKQ